MTEPSEAPEKSNLGQSDDIWQEDSLSVFEGLRMKRYEKFSRISKVRKLPYTVYRITLSPIENPTREVKTEVFKSQFDRIRALRMKDDKAVLKVTVEGIGKERVITWSNVSILD